MADHTPGPWRVLYPGIYDVENPYPIAKVHKTDRSGTEIDANARLIAAAPNMLAALKEIISILGGTCWDGCRKRDCRSVRVARAAIAKVKGEDTG